MTTSSPNSSAGPHAPGSRRRPAGVAREVSALGKTSAARSLPAERYFALPLLLGAGMGRVPCRHTADAHGRRGAAAPFAQRPGRPRGSAANLPFAVASALRSRRIVAAPVRAAQAVPRPGEYQQDALRHRHRGLGCGRQVDDGAHPDGTARPLALEPEGRSGDDGWLPAAERRAAPGKPYGAQGLSGELRHRRPFALSLRDQGRPAAREGAGLFPPDLRRRSGQVRHDRPPGHPRLRRHQRASGSRPARRRQDRPLRVGLLRLLDLYRRRGSN